MVKTALFGAVLFIGIAIYPVSETWAQSQRDAVCQGSCGGGCGPCSTTGGGGSTGNRSRSRPSAAEIAAQQAYALNDQGLAAYTKKDWAAAEADFRRALQLSPNDQIIRRNLGMSQGHEGEDAYRNGDYTTALNYFQQALANVPADVSSRHILSEDLAAAQERLDQAKRDEEQRRQDKITANNMQQSIQNLAQSMTAAPASGGLDFIDPKSTTSATAGDGSKSGGLDFVDPSEPLKDAPSDKKAGDQLLSAAASGDLTKNYDIGGANAAGSLKIPTNASIDPATFSDKVKNDPRMIAALKQLDGLKAARSKLGTELEQLTTKMKTEKDPQKMKALTQEMDQKNVEYQANLLAITKGEETVKKVHRTIDDKVDEKPAPAKN
jgi:tetratricopeptide (TPR) repeat protein